MLELFFIVFIGFIGYISGAIDIEHSYQEKCVAKYAEMPHNKVEDYCKTILKFEKDPK
jgi:hypothetical protein